MTEKDVNPNGYALSQEYAANLKLLLEKMNTLESLTDKRFKVTSGFRTLRDQAAIDDKAGRKTTLGSAHLKAAACDVFDPDCELQEWCLENESTLQCLGIHCEDFDYCKKPSAWVHFQVIPPKSGKTFFIPYALK